MSFLFGSFKLVVIVMHHCNFFNAYSFVQLNELSIYYRAVFLVFPVTSKFYHMKKMSIKKNNTLKKFNWLS